MRKKILVLGGSGLVGSTFINYTKDIYDIHYTFNQNEIQFNNIPSTKINIVENSRELHELMKNFIPEVIVHTISHPSVDECEKNLEIGKKLHIESTKEISNMSKKINSKLIYLSTDAVFDGKSNKKYTENDEPNPINQYGKSKLEAEKIIVNASEQNVILRPSVIYGWHKKSRFTNWIIESLQNGKVVDPHNDQYNTPTLVDDLVKSIIKIIDKNISGLFHSTGKTCVNRYELACNVAEVFNFNKKLIKPVSSIEKKQDAPRPPRTCLDSTKLEIATDYKFKELDEGLKFLLEKSLEKHNKSFQIV